MNHINNLKLRTEIERLPFPFTMEIGSRVLCLGSCFSQAIGRHLDNYKITNHTNPFGVLFNPISIAKNLLNALTAPEIVPDLFIQKENRYVHFNYHSDLWGNDISDLANKIKTKNHETKDNLGSADLLILTFGTAWLHILKENNYIVANCHKHKAVDFSKRLINQDEFESSFGILFEKLKAINPSLHILLSVSPIIHSKEGLLGNSVSKSALVYFSHRLAEKYENVSYFPGYEIMKEDLRDYRFYKEDLIHPTEQSEKYILNYFAEQLGSEEFKAHLVQFNKIQNNLRHRPFDEKSLLYLKHLKHTLTELNEYPFAIDLEKEKAFVFQKITDLQKATGR